MGMKTYIQTLAFAAVWITVKCATIDPDRPVFSKALELVKTAAKQSGNINYNEFCQRKGQGTFKQGCQIKAMPDVGLLVCLYNFGDSCKTTLTREFDSLNTLVRAKLKVLPFHNQLIDGLKCAEAQSTDFGCSGYLIQWVSAEKGKEQHLRSYFRYDTTDTLLKWLKTYQKTEEARSITRTDLKKLLKFTDPGGENCVYTRICDLQGYFMKSGGYEIADPDQVISGEDLDYTCHSQDVYPKTRKVIAGLKKMIKELEPE